MVVLNQGDAIGAKAFVERAVVACERCAALWDDGLVWMGVMRVSVCRGRVLKLFRAHGILVSREQWRFLAK